MGAATNELEVEAVEHDDEVEAFRVMLGDDDADALDWSRGKGG
jgi:hypothetical protein